MNSGNSGLSVWCYGMQSFEENMNLEVALVFSYTQEAAQGQRISSDL